MRSPSPVMGRARVFVEVVVSFMNVSLLLEVISPAGFEQFFAELASLIAAGPFDDQALGALNAAYGLQVDPEGTARIAAEYRLVTAPQ
jgi:hypothetical protein